MTAMNTTTTTSTGSNQQQQGGEEEVVEWCENHRSNSSNQPLIKPSGATGPSPTPSWKLYDNPSYDIYTSTTPPSFPRQVRPSSSSSSYLHHHRSYILHPKYIASKHLHHRLHNLPFYTAPARSFPLMESETIDDLRAQIKELKAELHIERRLRKKIESLNKKLVKELAEEREEMERGCEEIVRELEWKRSEEIEKMKKEMEQERKMLKVAEVFREERVQMKLADAKMMYEEKMNLLEELGGSNNAAGKKMSLRSAEENNGTWRRSANNGGNNNNSNNNDVRLIPSFDSVAMAGCLSSAAAAAAVEVQRSVPVNCSGERCATPISGQRKVGPTNSPEPENPHIKRGIKGYVEFPKVVKAINGSNNTINNNHKNNGARNSSSSSSSSSSMAMMGTKLQYCQKAQLRILLKQRSPLRSSSSSNLIIS